MRKNEMKKAMEAGTPVAIGPKHGSSSVRKATIVGFNAKRRVYSGARHDFGSHLSNDGVRIRYDDPRDGDRYNRPILRFLGFKGDEYEDTEDCVVGSREVLNTWDEFKRQSAAIAFRKEEERKAVNEKADRCLRLVQALTDTGFPAYADHSVGRYQNIRMTMEVAERLLDTLKITERV